MMPIKQKYQHYRRRQRIILLVLISLLIIALFSALGIGSTQLGWKDIFNYFSGNASIGSQQVILNIRLPRIIAAVLCVWALALSGCIMQIILRNSLASPFTLGISNAAAFGAAIIIVLCDTENINTTGSDLPLITSPYFVALGAFINSMVALAVILLISKHLKNSPQTIILSGIIISSLFGAALDTVQYISTTSQLASIIFWMFGNLGNTDWNALLLITIVIAPSSLIIYYNRWNYRAVSAGDDYARSLGINPSSTRVIALSLAALCTSVVVSFFGVIAFIGLVVPHMMRKVVGSNEEFLLPASAIVGALFLLVCDTIARAAFSPVILPVGIITSLIGAPTFLFLLLKIRKT